MSRGRVGVRLLGPLLSYLQAREVDAAVLAKQVGLDPATFLDLEQRLDAAKAVRFFEAAAHAVADPLLGLHVGATVTRESFDLLSQATAVSLTLRDMGERLSRFVAMAVPGPVYELREEGDVAWWVIADVFPKRGCVRQLCELAVSLGVSYTRQRTAEQHVPLRVHFDHEPAASLRAYRQVLGADVRFSQHEAGFAIPRALLDRPLASADPGLAKVLDRYAHEVVSKLPREDDLPQRVTELIARSIARGKNLELSTVAKTLALSPRSLQRKLAEQGQAFQTLVDVERQKHALRLLEQDGASLKEISERLGFTDVAAFRRAFKRWTGLSPRAYRTRR